MFSLGGSNLKLAFLWQWNPSSIQDKLTSISAVSFVLTVVSHVHTMYQH
jgi:hypothetical protein